LDAYLTEDLDDEPNRNPYVVGIGPWIYDESRVFRNFILFLYYNLVLISNHLQKYGK
jgi:hypothetical protein